ncbi:hypothetical protein LXL04_034424 [Taraxacum kok-saghyz]
MNEYEPEFSSSNLDIRLKMAIGFSNWEYLVSFEQLYNTIIEARLKLNAKIKEATKKFLANPEINDWRP